MYALGHTSHTLIGLSDSAVAKVRARAAKCKINFKHCFYRANIKNETWSFFKDYEDAKGEQCMLHLHGSQS